MLIIDIKQRSDTIIAAAIAAIIMCQNPIWPLWGGIGTGISYLLVFILFVFRYKSILFLIGTNLRAYSCFCLLCTFFLLCPFFSGFHASNIFIIMSVFVAWKATEQEKKKALNYLTKILAFIILFSLPFWLIHVFIYELPSFGEIDNSEFKGMSYTMNNYLLFVTMSTASTFRFYSMFDEPGVLGTLSAFILFGNRYDFTRKSNVIILVGAFFTFSFAFYLLTIIGYLITSVRSFKYLILSMILLTTIPVVMYFSLKDNLAFQYSVIERFSNGAVSSLDHRTGHKAALFYNTFITSSDAWLGIGYDKMMEQNLREGQSYKLFIIEYGVLALLVLMGTYFCLAGRKSVYIYVFYILFFLSFLQRPFAFTAWQILTFSCVASSLRKE